MNLSYLAESRLEGPSMHRGTCEVLQQAILTQACRVILALHFLYSGSSGRLPVSSSSSSPPVTTAAATARDNHSIDALTLVQLGLVGGGGSGASHGSPTLASLASTTATTAAANQNNAGPSSSLLASEYTFTSAAQVKQCLNSAPRYSLLTAAHLLRCRGGGGGGGAHRRCRHGQGRLAGLVSSIIGAECGTMAFRAEALVLLTEWLLKDRGEDQALVAKALDVSPVGNNNGRASGVLDETMNRCISSGDNDASALWDNESSIGNGSSSIGNDNTSGGGSGGPRRRRHRVARRRDLLLQVFPELRTTDDWHPSDGNNISIDCGCPHRWFREELPRWLLAAALMEHATAWRQTTVLSRAFNQWCLRRGFRMLNQMADEHEQNQHQHHHSSLDGPLSPPPLLPPPVSLSSIEKQKRKKQMKQQRNKSTRSPPEADRETRGPSSRASRHSTDDMGNAEDGDDDTNDDNSGSLTDRAARQLVALPSLDGGTAGQVAPPPPDTATATAAATAGEEAKDCLFDDASTIGSVQSLPSETAPSPAPPDEEAEQAYSRHSGSSGNNDNVSDPSRLEAALSGLGSALLRSATSQYQQQQKESKAEEEAAAAARAGCVATHQRRTLSSCFYRWRDAKYYVALSTCYMAALAEENTLRSCLSRWRARASVRGGERRVADLERICALAITGRGTDRHHAMLLRWRHAAAARRFARRTFAARAFRTWRALCSLRRFGRRGAASSARDSASIVVFVERTEHQRHRGATRHPHRDDGSNDVGGCEGSDQTVPTSTRITVALGADEAKRFVLKTWHDRFLSHRASAFRRSHLQRGLFRAMHTAHHHRAHRRLIDRQADLVLVGRLFTRWRQQHQLHCTVASFQVGRRTTALATPCEVYVTASASGDGGGLCLETFAHWRARTATRIGLRSTEAAQRDATERRLLGGCLSLWVKRCRLEGTLRRHCFRGSGGGGHYSNSNSRAPTLRPGAMPPPPPLVLSCWQRWQGRLAGRRLLRRDRALHAEAVFLRELSRRCVRRWHRRLTASRAATEADRAAGEERRAALLLRQRLTARVFYHWRAKQYLLAVMGVDARRAVPSAAVAREAEEAHRRRAVMASAAVSVVARRDAHSVWSGDSANDGVQGVLLPPRSESEPDPVQPKGSCRSSAAPQRKAAQEGLRALPAGSKAATSVIKAVAVAPVSDRGGAAITTTSQRTASISAASAAAPLRVHRDLLTYLSNKAARGGATKHHQNRIHHQQQQQGWWLRGINRSDDEQAEGEGEEAARPEQRQAPPIAVAPLHQTISVIPRPRTDSRPYRATGEHITYSTPDTSFDAALGATMAADNPSAPVLPPTAAVVASDNGALIAGDTPRKSPARQSSPSSRQRLRPRPSAAAAALAATPPMCSPYATSTPRRGAAPTATSDGLNISYHHHHAETSPGRTGSPQTSPSGRKHWQPVWH